MQQLQTYLTLDLAVFDQLAELISWIVRSVLNSHKDLMKRSAWLLFFLQNCACAKTLPIHYHS